MSERVYGVLHVFCGLGGGGRGFKRARAHFRGTEARFECLAALDADPEAVADYPVITGGDQATVADLFTAEDYEAFHGRPPPEGWSEFTVADLRRVCGRRPDVVFGSPPCKGLSALQSKARAASPKYQALNRLVTRWLMLVLAAWPDDPPPLILLENVPRIAGARGEELLNQVKKLLWDEGYHLHEGLHCCGEIADPPLSQRRKRFLLVARRPKACPAILYKPERRAPRSIGAALAELPMPGDPAGGPMHTLPAITMETWQRLALIRPGKDWRDLEERWALGPWWLVPVAPGVLRLVQGCQAQGEQLCDPGSIGPWHPGILGVRTMGEPCGTVTARAEPTTGAFSLADPRLGCTPNGATLRVCRADRPSPTVVGRSDVWSSGALNVADPRRRSGGRYSNVEQVASWDLSAPAVTGATRPVAGAISVNDPRGARTGKRFNNICRLADWHQASPAVTGGTRPSSGGLCVGDVRLPPAQGRHSNKYRVDAWDGPGHTVTSARVGSGAQLVADPRGRAGQPPIIISDDDTWHRPLTPLELARLQSLPVFDAQGQPLQLAGRARQGWLNRIGNAVPPDTAQAIAEQMLMTLLVGDAQAWTFDGPGGVWVDGRRMAIWPVVRRAA